MRVSPISLLSIALLISTSILSGCEDPAVANKPSLPGIDATPSPIFPEPSSPALIRDVALNAPVEIIHDEHDIPHIFAKSDRDLFFASGYQVATDRLFTLDINRRKATGRLAEVFGEGGVSNDIQANVLGFKKWARPSLEAMAKERPGDYELLLAYTSGINRRVAEVLADPALTPEGFERNDYSPEPFSPEDLLSIGIRIQFGYSSTLEFDLLTTFLARTQPAAFKELAIFQPGANAFTMVWGTSFASALQPSIPSPLDRLPQEPLELRPDELQELIDGMRRFRYNLRVGEGSNGWSVHGDHTFNGKPIVANDSHSGLSDPNDLYLMHLNSAEAGGDFDVMGYAFIGVPGIHLGHNDKLTWAATTHFADMTDLWDVRLDREALTAELGGFTATLDQRTITYKVRGEDGKLEERELVVEEVPGYGVILPDELLPVPSGLLARGSLMLGWPGWEPNTELFMFLDFDRATTLDDFKRAIDRQRVGMQNWQAATASGHVYYTNGNVPDRGPLETRGTPNMIMDGKNPDHLWLRGYLPKSRIPKLDGTQPFLMTANNDPWGHTADNDPLNDEFYYGSFYAPGFRAAELRDRLTELTERGDITREEMQALQLDQRSLIADGLIPHLRDAVDNLSTMDCQTEPPEESDLPPCDLQELSDTLDALEAWDTVMGKESREALIWRLWITFASRALLEDNVSAMLFFAVDDAQPVTIVKLLTRAILDQNEVLLGEDGERDMALALARAVAVAKTYDGVREGYWGDLHVAYYTTPDDLATQDPIGGDDTSINVAQSRCWENEELAEFCLSFAGAVFRSVTVFDDNDRPVTHFNWVKGNGPDTQDWLDGTYRQWPFSREEIESGMTSSAMLEVE